jgi:hypothetical protein
MQRAIPTRTLAIYLPQIAAHSKELLYRHFQLIFYSQLIHGNHYRATRQPVPTLRDVMPEPSNEAPQNFPANAALFI